MTYRALYLTLLLAACAAPAQPRTGPPSPNQDNWPQAREQCQAQPNLEWCKPHGR